MLQQKYTVYNFRSFVLCGPWKGYIYSYTCRNCHKWSMRQLHLEPMKLNKVVKTLLSSILSLCRTAATITSLLSTTYCWKESESIAPNSWAVSVEPGARDPEAPLTPPAQRSAPQQSVCKLIWTPVCILKLKSIMLYVFWFLPGNYGVLQQL